MNNNHKIKENEIHDDKNKETVGFQRLKFLINNYSNTAKKITFLALPVIGSSLLEALIFLVDRAMLGHYSPDALASMQINSPVVWSLWNVLSSFSIGSVALLGRAIGSDDSTLASTVARTSLLLALVIGVVASLLCLSTLEIILDLFKGAGANVQQAARDYLTIVLPAMPLFIISAVATSLFRGAGNTQLPFWTGLAANLVNIAFNYCFIFGHFGVPKLGVSGAAIGSVIAISLNLAILLIVLAGYHGGITIRGRGGEWSVLKRIFSISIPSFGEKIVKHGGYLFFVAMIGGLGSTAMAAHQALLSIESFCFRFAEGVGTATTTVVAQSLGAEAHEDAIRSAKIATFIALCILSLCSLAFCTMPVSLLGIFSPDSKIILLGIPCLYIAAVAQPFMAVSYVLGAVLHGAGDTMRAFQISLIGRLVVRLVASFFFAYVLNLGLVGIWIGSTIDWLIRSIILGIVFLKGRWLEIKL